MLARDRIGVPATGTVTLDVDKNNDGDFLDAGETGYATGNLFDGQVTIKLSALSTTGTYPMQARVTDSAGNEGTSATQTVVVSSVASPWVATTQALSADPLTGDPLMQMGDAVLTHPIDIDRSPGTRQGGDFALVYHSGNVAQKPIVQVSVPSANNAALPATITGKLTFNGVGAASVAYSTSGFAPGDVFTFALQASQSITTTGRYGYSVLVKITGQADQTVTGSTYIVAQDASALGSGWTIAGVDRLVSIAADGNGPAGMLRVYGSGGWRFSPPQWVKSGKARVSFFPWPRCRGSQPSAPRTPPFSPLRVVGRGCQHVGLVSRPVFHHRLPWGIAHSPAPPLDSWPVE